MTSDTQFPGRPGQAAPSRWLAVGLLLAASLSSGGVAEAQNLSRALTDEERAQLRGGELVARETVEMRGRLRLVGGTSYQVVDRSLETVWRAMTSDSQEYRHMLPQVRSATEVRRRGDRRVIRFLHRVGPVRVSYALKFTFDESRNVIMFQLDERESNDIRAAWGFLRLRRWGNDKTLVSFGAMVDIGTSVLSAAVLPTVHEWVLKIPYTIRRHLDAHGDQFERTDG